MTGHVKNTKMSQQTLFTEFQKYLYANWSYIKQKIPLNFALPTVMHLSPQVDWRKKKISLTASQEIGHQQNKGACRLYEIQIKEDAVNRNLGK